ncbi:DoxX family protein [Paracoccus fistulariae]|uniref:DoxX family protein n=1 Tax=Paracoccus fistulariae TaxID=658446 RepID=A0ABY7SFG8_9RHOB|nr:DoxX family protein [Paracoccus fistulariae]MDB6182705.1 DoxX family protein [Paracoccus fistulariae]WCR05731.1 DoxX family protein [Paracoccus fistulariae]
MLQDLNTRLNNPGLGALILRVTLGLLFLAHAWLKLVVFTPAGTAQFFQSIGLPGALAYLTIAAEILGGIALLTGFQVRLVALALIPLILGTIIFSHGANGFFFSNEGGGWEYPAVWAVALLVQALIGPGDAAITRD